MSHNITHTEQRDEIRRLIIGAPLLLTAVFCFGLATIHPVGSTVNQSAGSSESSHAKKPVHASSSAVNTLAPLPLAKTSLNTLPPASPADSYGSVGGSTASPQSTAGDSSAAKTTSGLLSAPSTKTGTNGTNGGLIHSTLNSVFNRL